MSSLPVRVRLVLLALALGASTWIGPARAGETTSAAGDADAEAATAIIVLTPAERVDFKKIYALMLGARAADARVRTLAGTSQAFVDEETLPAAERVTVDTLAEQARGSTDPFVLSLLVQLCGNDRLKPKPTCDAVALARRWTVADTQNQIAWLTLASTLRWSGDADGARAAFMRGADASTWHELYDDGPRVMTAALPKQLGPRARIALQSATLSASAAWLVPMTAVQELSFRCKDETLRAACHRIVDTIDRDGASLFSKQTASSFGRRYGFDPDTVERRSRAVDALLFATGSSGLKDWREITDPAELESQTRLWDRRIALGEMAWGREALEAGGPERRAAAERDHAEHNAARNRAAADEKRRLANR